MRKGLSLPAAVLVAALMAAPAATAAPEATTATPDTEITVGDVSLACTGIGQTKLDPRWNSYPVRVEFSDAKNAYLADVELTVRDAKRRELLTVRCAGPWVLLKLHSGAYRAEGRLPNTTAKPRTAPFRPPASGQMRLVLQFPDA